ncbi:MAG: glycosyltransferase family 4 protein [bacterium]|nr:glycosyltransferase family 4 protein [bacterium]
MNKTRILIFSTAYLPFVGGAEVAVKEITERLPGFEFVMITAKLRSDLADMEKIGNIEVHRLGRGNGWDKFRLIWGGWKLARSLGKFDAVWSIMASYAGFAALRFKTRNPSVPFLLTLQEGDSRWQIYKHVWWCWPYFKQIFKRADKIQAISNYLAEWAKRMGARCPVVVVPNGVTIHNFDPQEKSRDLKRVITTSRLVKKNGLEFLIKAIKLVNDNYDQPVVLKIFGDGELKNSLKKLAKSLGIQDRFVIFEGSVYHEKVYECLIQADVFVRPSLSEGLGNSFLEAMAAGVPIIGTKVGGIPDFLIDGETGLFCKAEPEDIARQIKRIFDDHQLAEQLRYNAQKLVQEKYSWDLISERMKNIFETI